MERKLRPRLYASTGARGAPVGWWRPTRWLHIASEWREPWFWWALMGAGQIVASLVVCAVAWTRVVLPYDEAFLGMNRAGIMAVNARLLDFMEHDRVSFGITAFSLGINYTGLALYGVRSGYRWARWAVVASAIPGFTSFLLFLRFDYLDPLHALVTAMLSSLLVAGLLAARGSPPFLYAGAQDMLRDRAWRRGRVGQTLFVLTGVGLTGARLAIAYVGSTEVFIPTDLQFMDTTAAELAAANDRLPSLVAHDRAGFGGVLFADGLAVTAIAAWGFRRGERWVWWTLALSGGLGFLGAIGTHVVIGYTDVRHLLPAYAAVATFVLACMLSSPFLRGPVPTAGASSHKPLSQ